MKEGYVKLYRQLLDNPVFLNEKLLKVWVWCLLTAVHSDREVVTQGGTIVTLKPGQFIFGKNQGAMENGLSPTTFYRMISTLKDLGMLSTSANNKWTVATVENWGLYQIEASKVGQREEKKWTPNRQLEALEFQGVDGVRKTEIGPEMDTIQEYNNNIYIKAQRKPDRKKIPPTLDMVTEYCKKRNNDIDPQYFIDYYETRDWQVGKTKMKDWQAAIRTWERNSNNRKADTTCQASQEVKRYDI